MKPRILDDIMSEGSCVVKVVGINMKEIDFSHDKKLDNYIKAIESIITDDLNRLYIEESKNISKEKLIHMENILGLKLGRQNIVKICHLPLIIRKIYDLSNNSLENKEVLIISEDKELTKQIVKKIGNDIKFITILGCSQEENEEIYEYILEETGLSLFQSSNINRILGRYSIIVNFVDSLKIETRKIRKSSLVFDFSSEKPFKRMESERNRLFPIEDFIFDTEDLDINAGKWLGNQMDSKLYETLYGEKLGDVKYLYSINNYYSIENYVKSYIKIKGKL